MAAVLIMIELALFTAVSSPQMSFPFLAEVNAPFLLEGLSEESSRAPVGVMPSTPPTSAFPFEDSPPPPLASSRSQAATLASTPSYATHTPLNITGDADFLLQNASDPFCWAGTGIENDPYIIEGLNITLDPSATTPALSLTNTTFYFILRASWLAGAHQYQTGVYLDNVTHGTIANNTIQNAAVGIHLAPHSANNSISRNTVFNCTGYGIRLDPDTQSNNVTWNNFFHNTQGAKQAWDAGQWNFSITPKAPNRPGTPASGISLTTIIGMTISIQMPIKMALRMITI
jgi:parallel beta-helix repeat protein